MTFKVLLSSPHHCTTLLLKAFGRGKYSVRSCVAVKVNNLKQNKKEIGTSSGQGLLLWELTAKSKAAVRLKQTKYL